MVGTWKVLNKSSPGSGTEFGADDTDKINKLLRGDLDVDTAEINSIFRFRDGKLYLRDSLNLKNYIVRTSGIISDRQITLPLLTGDDVFTFNDHAATLTQKILAGARISNYFDVESTSTPGNPGANVLRVYRRTSDNQLVYRNNTGTETVLGGTDGGGGGATGEINTASNIGTGGVGIFKNKIGFDLQFKKLNGATAGQITVIDDTAGNEVDLKVTPAAVEGNYMRTVGGAVTWDKPAKIMPDGSYYTGPKWGSFIGGATDGDGWFSGLYTTGTLSSTGTLQQHTIWRTGAVDQEMAGWGTHLRALRLALTPRFKWRGFFNPSTERGWTGFIDQNGGAWLGGDDPLINRNGLMCGYGTADTNWVIKWNNGGATPQTVSTGIVKDTNSHVVELLLNSATSSVSAWFDSNLVVNASTTQVPASATGVTAAAICQAVGATATDVGTEYAMVTFP